MLTKSDLEQIKNYLALYGKKDSQLETVPVNLDYPEVTFEANDYLSVVQDSKNKTIKIKDLEKVFLLTFLTDEDFREALKGKIPEEMLENACVTTEKLADGAVTTIKLGDNAVTTAKIATGAITGDKIVNNTIQGSAFAANSITTDKIVDGTVTGDKLADGSIQSVDIKDNTLSGSKFIDNSISGSKIQDNVIESKHLLDNSIPASKIKDGSIESVDIKDGTLDGAKIKDNTIESVKLANNAITTDKIIDNSIITSKIANDAVTEDKIVDNSITTNKIVNSSVTTDKIVDEAITEDKLADGAVTTAKLADGLISDIQNITDTTPTTGSVKPVQSGGVQNELALGAVYDVSAKNPTAGPNNNGKWESLSALLADTNINTLIPTSVRKGGMSIKFVQSSDNKYVRFNYLLSSVIDIDFSNINNWLGINNNSLISNDTEPTTNNSVFLDDAYQVAYSSANYQMKTDGFFGANDSYKHVYLPVSAGEKYHIDGIASNVLRVAFATTNKAVSEGVVPVVTGTSVYEIPANTSIWVRIPDGCTYLLLWRNNVATGFVVKKSLFIKNYLGLELSRRITIGDAFKIPVNEHLPLIPTSIYTPNRIDLNGDIIASTSISSVPAVCEYAVTQGKVYHITCIGTSRSFLLYAMYSNGTYVTGAAGDGVTLLNDFLLVIPDSVDTLRISTSNINSTPLCEVIEKRVVYPELVYDTTKRTGQFSQDDQGKKYITTPRFIKVEGDKISLLATEDCYISFRKFDKDFNVVNDSESNQAKMTANNIFTRSISGCRYIKFQICKDDDHTVDMPLTKIAVIGDIPKDWDTYNIRPADSGYQRIMVHPNVTNPNCCDTITDNVQDTETLLTDYGIIALPSQYSNTGTPTRLIIYCHGAAVNYASDVARFNSVDLEPDYWLAEGYAVMDVEGNPYNNEDEHFYIPQAMECYIAAYKWAIQHYNLKRDGVFLGGRSMGGEMTFNLLRRECNIPVIAGCPNATAPVPSHLWNYMNAQRRAFCATHMGFIVPTDYTTYPWAENFAWTSDSPMTNAEWECLKYNFKTLAKYTPVWNMLLDLKSADVMLNSEMNVSKSTVNVPKEIEVYTALHAAVKAPIKLFAVLDDASSIYERATYLYKTMLENSGQLVETRLFQTGGHHYDTQNPNLRTTITTRYGVEMTNVPVVYIEMLQFWRRYEQGN